MFNITTPSGHFNLNQNFEWEKKRATAYSHISFSYKRPKKMRKELIRTALNKSPWTESRIQTFLTIFQAYKPWGLPGHE